MAVFGCPADVQIVLRTFKCLRRSFVLRTFNLSFGRSICPSDVQMPSAFNLSFGRSTCPADVQLPSAFKCLRCLMLRILDYYGCFYCFSFLGKLLFFWPVFCREIVRVSFVEALWVVLPFRHLQKGAL